MVVAAGDQRGAGRRAERSRVEVGVAQPVVGDAVKRRRRDDAAEGRGRGEADVVGQDEQNVRRALRRHDARRPIGLRLRGVELDLAAELLRRRRQHAAVDRRGRVRRARRAVDLLRAGRAEPSDNGDGRSEQQSKGRTCDHPRRSLLRSPEDILSPGQLSSGWSACEDCPERAFNHKSATGSQCPDPPGRLDMTPWRARGPIGPTAAIYRSARPPSLTWRAKN